MSDESVDFNQAGLDLHKRLGIVGGNGGSTYNTMDPIFTHATTGGTIYVGNESAARSLQSLRERGITHVVNCTHGFSAIPNYHPTAFAYLTFEIAEWSQKIGPSDDSAAAFVAPLWAFIDSALAQGGSVLVHCLAGAHRAGTTGCACLIHYGRILDVPTAIRTAQSLRRIIDPIGRLPHFLNRVLRLELQASTLPSPSAPPASSGGEGGSSSSSSSSESK